MKDITKHDLIIMFMINVIVVFIIISLLLIAIDEGAIERHHELKQLIIERT